MADRSADSERRTRISLLCELTHAIAAPRPQRIQGVLASCAACGAIAPGDVEEAILQSVPYSGIPGAVEALGIWRTRHPERAFAPPEETPGPDRRLRDGEVGAKNFALVYGEHAERVRAELRRSHPALERWVLEFGYGRVMGRGVIPLGDLEMLGVASLLAQEREVPLVSHLRGALRNGWRSVDIEQVIDLLAPCSSPAIVSFARATLPALAPPE